MQMVGHQKQWQFLKKSLELNRLSHAYLFSGIASLGKKTLALEFIKLINCQNENSNEKPCGQCNFCKMIEKKNFPDLFIISPPHQNFGSGGKPEREDSPIQISQIRELQHFLSFRPYYGQWKSVVLQEAEKMTKDSQSCLLKTLEETKGQTLLILISSYPDLLLPTIYSRCQIIKFFPVSQLEIKNYLISKGVLEKKADLLSRISQGKPGRAINFLLNPDRLDEENQILKEILKICHSDLAVRFQYVKNLTLSKNNIKDILEILQRHLRSVLLSEGTLPEGMGTVPVRGLSPKLKFIDTINFLIFSTNINPKLALEMLFMEL